MKTVVIAIALSGLSMPVGAQWLTQPTKDIPRTADGKPDLNAPTPRTPEDRPDLSGLWTRTSRKVAAELKPIQPWVDGLVQQRREDFARDSQQVQCLPLGPQYIINRLNDRNIGGMQKVVQTAALILILIPTLDYRQIHMDGRALEPDPNPTWMGYSVGRWEGDTLVVESNGFNDRTWLDIDGHPHTEALRITERYRRQDFGHLELDVTLSDAALYATPWTATITAELTPDTEMLEYVCNENTRPREHWVGKRSDDRSAEVRVGADVLARYNDGTYVEQPPFYNLATVPRTFEIRFADGALFLGQARLVAQSETVFDNNGSGLEFVKAGAGVVTHLVESRLAGNFRFTRRR